MSENHEVLELSTSGSKEDRFANDSVLAQDLLAVKSCVLVNHITENLLASDLKWSLFCAACNSYRFDSVLKPFPQFFMLRENKKEIERLRNVIVHCPSMPNIIKHLKDNTLGSTLTDLLYWVLISLSEPYFKYVPKTEHQNILNKVSSKNTATMPDFIFSVNYGTKQHRKFQLNKSNYSTKFAFHGSRLDNFYSIVNYGLQVSFNKNTAFGPGIYLSNEMVVSLPYSSRGFTWDYSLFGSHISIVALCEVICHPLVRSENDSNKFSILEISNKKSVSGKYIIVENSDLVQIQYLLVYTNDEYETTSLLQSRTLLGWFKRHKMFAFIIGYIIFLLGIGSYNSSVLFKYFRKFLKRFEKPECIY